MIFKPSKEFLKFVESCPVINNRDFAFIEERKKQYLREKNPQGHILLRVPFKGTKFILEYYLSRPLRLLFALGGYLNRKGDPGVALREWLDQKVETIKGLEREANSHSKKGVRHDEEGGKEET